jgi:hypothetical protein
MARYCVYSGAGSPGTGTVAGTVPTSGEWNTAYASVTACLAAITEAAGDIIFVAHDHNHNAAGAITWTLTHTTGLVQIVSIDRANTTTATPLVGGRETTGGNTAFNVVPGFMLYVFGMTLETGAGGASASAQIQLNNSTGDGSEVYDSCTFYTNTTNTAVVVQISAASQQNSGFSRFINCIRKAAAASTNSIQLNASAYLEIVNLALAGTAPVSVFAVATRSTWLNISASDLSAATNLVNIASDDVPCRIIGNNLKLPTNITTGAHQGMGSMVIELHACSTADHNYDFYYQDGVGVIQEDVSIYLASGGAQQVDNGGTTVPYSLQFNPDASVNLAFPLCGPWSYIFVASAGSKTVSMKMAYDSATSIKDIEAFIEVEYMGGAAAANCPQSQVENSAPLVSGLIARNLLAAGSNLTDTSESWTGTGGFSNKKTHTLSKTVSVDEIGYMRARICVGKDQTCYVDQRVLVA